jgi:uncharacterized protein (TIGR00369 family)
MTRLEPQNPNFARDLEGLVLSMPIVRFYGARFLRIDPGAVEVEMPYRDELAFVPGAFHAGAIGTLVDVAAGCSVATLLPAGWGNATVDYSVKLLAPATGSVLVAHGVALSAGKTLSVGEAKVFSVANGVWTLCATGMVTVRNFAAAAPPA